jgi:p-aminobenzoyl-glutamate transporter AbgT
VNTHRTGLYSNAPQTLLAAYRVGDSPMNVITPLMVYLPAVHRHRCLRGT